MNKKLFSWKALAGTVLFAALTMGLSSCTQTQPDPEPEPEPQPVVDPFEIDGDVITINKVSPKDISAILASKDLGLKADQEYTIVFANPLEVTKTDYTIAIPELTDATINLVFAQAFAKDEVKLVITDNALDFVNLFFAEGSFKGLDLEMPYSTVTINSLAAIIDILGAGTRAADGEVNIGELQVNMDVEDVAYWSKSQTIGMRYALLTPGVIVGGLDYRNGLVIVLNGAEIKAYIAGNAPVGGRTFTPVVYNAKTDSWKSGDQKKYNFETVYIECSEGLLYNANQPVAYDQNFNPYGFKNLIVRKNETPYVDATGVAYGDFGFVFLSYDGDVRDRGAIDQITVEDGGNLLIDEDYLLEDATYTSEINGAKFVGYNTTWGSRNSANERAIWSQLIRAKKIVGAGKGVVSYNFDIPNTITDAFKGAESVSGVVVASSILPQYEIAEADWTDGWGVNSISVAAPVSNCTFSQFGMVTFTIASTEVATSKFPSANFVYFNVNATDSRTAYRFNYNACEFKANATLGVNDFTRGDLMLDEKGNPIVYNVYDYAMVNAAGTDFVYEQNTPYYDYEGNPQQDADGFTLFTDDIADWNYVYANGDYVEVDITKWNYFYDLNSRDMGKIFFKDGVYAIFDHFVDPRTAKEKWIGYKIEVVKVYKWVYNQRISYKEIPLLARKAGLLTYRTVYAQETNREVEDMMITIGLTGNKIGGKDITPKSEIAVRTPNYLSGNANRTDAKFKYRFDFNGKLYRYAWDTIGGHWFFIPVE